MFSVGLAVGQCIKRNHDGTLGTTAADDAVFAPSIVRYGNVWKLLRGSIVASSDAMEVVFFINIHRHELKWNVSCFK